MLFASILKTQTVIALLLIIFSSSLYAGDSAMTHLDIVKSTYEGKNSEENARNLMNFLDDQVRWTEAAGFPLAGTYIGKEAIQQKVFTPLAEQWLNYRFTPEQYIAGEKSADGVSSVVVIGTYYGTYRTTGKSFSARVAHHWQLEHNKIIRFEQFVDSVPVVAAMQ